MFGDPVYRIIQLIEVSSRQLHLPVFVAVAIKHF